jgi:Protein of unknown function (DUF3313)
MWHRKTRISCLAAALVTVSSCSSPANQSDVRKMPAGQEYSGFLSTYANLKPNPEFESTVSYVSQDPVKNVHKYVAVIIDPPVVYLSTDADVKGLPDRGRTALTEYFQQAITAAVEDAFPVVQAGGPLVLRLRSAIIGVDVGPAVPADQKNEKSLDRAINIGKVGVEVELVDSEAGQQIAAAVDRQHLGEGAMVGSVNFSREEKFRAATQAFDGWAKRLRDFLDSAHQLSKDDVARAEGTNFPFASELGPR